jgi:hypothetical protein
MTGVQEGADPIGRLIGLRYVVIPVSPEALETPGWFTDRLPEIPGTWGDARVA